MKEEIIKSKERVAAHGEVFTSKREVNDMLDLVKDETERIDSRFLEPACGTGNFLVEVLKRKLEIVHENYSKNQYEFEKYAIVALSSIYGVDILADNVQTCRDRLLGIFTHYYLKNYKTKINPDFLKSAEFLLERNILWGDALNLKTPDEKAEPITFSEWSLINGSMIKRRDYTLANLLMPRSSGENTLFSDLGEEAFIPNTIAEFPPMNFLNIGKNEQ